MISHTPFTFVGFGDSITLAGEVPEEERWLTLVGDRLRRMMPSEQITMINAGVGGNTSREGLARLDADVLAHAPNCVLVEFGGNDLTHEPERCVPPEEYLANLDAFRTRICAEAGAAMVLLTFTPVINAWHGWRDHPFHAPYGGIDEHVEEYRQLTKGFADKYGIPLIDIDRALRDACERDGTERYIQPDGVHLTTEGNRIVADTVANELNKIMFQM